MNEEATEPSRTPPAPLRRELLVESGHRCAIPTCRSTSVLEFAHIVPWAEVKKHEFDNMIVLCAMCHGLYDREKKIDRKAIYAYKQNLAVLNGRYNDFERRVLETFHDQGLDTAIELDYSATTDISMRNLVRDGIVNVSTPAQHQVVTSAGHTTFYAMGENPTIPAGGQRRGGFDSYRLTVKGRELVQRWYGAELIDGDGDESLPEVVTIDINGNIVQTVE